MTALLRQLFKRLRSDGVLGTLRLLPSWLWYRRETELDRRALILDKVLRKLRQA